MQSSLGALKVLESQLSDRKHGLELTREQQLEARERLLQELEGNASALHAKNEKEVARLQGLLHAMDQVRRCLPYARLTGTDLRENRINAPHLGNERN